MLASTLLGVIGRWRRLMRLYGLYWISTSLASVLCFMVAVWPLSLALSNNSYCQEVESQCTQVSSLSNCTSTRALGRASGPGSGPFLTAPPGKLLRATGQGLG